MFRLTLALILIAVIASIFGFTGIAISVAYIAKIVFFVALALLIISLLMGGYKRPPKG